MRGALLGTADEDPLVVETQRGRETKRMNDIIECNSG